MDFYAHVRLVTEPSITATNNRHCSTVSFTYSHPGLQHDAKLNRKVAVTIKCRNLFSFYFANQMTESSSDSELSLSQIAFSTDGCTFRLDPKETKLLWLNFVC